ncbi:hypothetical protein DEU56DRAFT_958827 [Suillus clintonianus]|uniref:uncharacterized protein n=1 Tax=Suillus clintonianus TaxID=1904413 RepID=UPI001B85E1F1|nr:uncharacterized protein DEU56DRAFT_958827 [Suillus clintonianus]KAG2127246.1 hypothetical protein DEU56DRAFT_958827 [Suillus clintonianus]
MSEDVFHVCQDISKEVVEVSKYYLDQRPLKHTLNSHLPTQQHFKPPSDSDTIEIGDYIQVMDGEHTGKRGIVDWCCKRESYLWFRDILTAHDTESSDDLSSIKVFTTMVRRTNLAQTIQFTKERGYDVRPGDAVSVARGPELGAKGIVQRVDFPNAHLILLCDGDKSLINVPIKFVIKLQNASLDTFKKDIGQEVFVIGGDRKGYRGTLYSLSLESCTIAVHGQPRTTIKLHDVVTRYGMRLDGVMLEDSDLISFCDVRKRSYLAPPPRSTTPPVEQVPSSSSALVTDPSLLPSNRWTTWSASPRSVDVQHDPSSSINPSSSSALQAWNVDALDSIDTRMEKSRDIGPLPWLMTKEFSLKLLTYHVLLKVSVGFMNGRLQKRFVSTACPDPFCVNGAPLSGEARRVIEEAEARVAHADRQRDEAEARRLVVLESYDELSKYLAAIESRAADARAGFQRILRDAGGHLVLTPIPNQIQHDHSPYSANPSITVEPPPRPLPPPPSTRGVRPRSGSFDDTSYLIAPLQPPSKRPRNDRGEYDHRPPLSATSMSRGRIPDIDSLPQQLPQIQHHNHHLTIRPTHKSHSRSSSRSSVRATSQDIEDLLLDAATDERSALNARDQQPQSPRAVLAAHQSKGIPVGPLDQPGELRTYQTHIFAPPVTGAPQKKGNESCTRELTFPSARECRTRNATPRIGRF